MQLISVLKEHISIPPESEKDLSQSLQKGLENFERINNIRMDIAFTSFSEEMKHALFETLFFLHINDERFQSWEYKATHVERVQGSVRTTLKKTDANLYLANCPAGISGISELPEIFRDDFIGYCQNIFEIDPTQTICSDVMPFQSISSLGSVGTVGHKTKKSDLDLQILYELSPFQYALNEWNNEGLLHALHIEIEEEVKNLCAKKNILHTILKKNPTAYEKLKNQAVVTIGKRYPYIYQVLIKKKSVFHHQVSEAQKKLHGLLVIELIEFITIAYQRKYAKELATQEQLVKDRINMIQEYIQNKFPTAEIYLFACSSESFRQGQHGTTLESKEASGSAYELILNYEVLEPGIQFSPNIPLHYLISRKFNNSDSFYHRIVNYIRFDCISVYDEIAHRIVDTGATPTLDLNYVLSHAGAAYWESFKASSGNLPKALLNLLRIESLHNSKYLHTIIELIKHPEIFQQLAQNVGLEFGYKSQLHTHGVSLKGLLEIEEHLPALRFDPWWVKFKILKIFYNDRNIQVDNSERRLIYRNLDLCMALHVQVSDAFHMQNPRTYREKFLVLFLKQAFPERSAHRTTLELLIRGDVQTINLFEKELHAIFANCMDRIHRLIAIHNIPDESNQQEFEIWFHYYQKNFEPSHLEIKRNILSHLRVPREKIRVHYEKTRRRGNWVFYAMSMTQKKQKNNHENLQILENYRPHEIDLTYSMSFLKGLAYCIINGYYGVIHAGSLQENSTEIEVDLNSIHLANMIDNQWSRINSEIAARLTLSITNFFPYRKIHYMDCIKGKYKISDIFFVLNLFRFGRVSVLYRDTLQRWFIEEMDHSNIVINAQEFYDKPHDLLTHSDFVQTIQEFAVLHQLSLKDKRIRYKFWYNPKSTKYAQSLPMQEREKSLAYHFEEAVTNIIKKFEDV